MRLLLKMRDLFTPDLQAVAVYLIHLPANYPGCPLMWCMDQGLLGLSSTLLWCSAHSHSTRGRELSSPDHRVPAKLYCIVLTSGSEGAISGAERIACWFSSSTCHRMAMDWSWENRFRGKEKHPTFSFSRGLVFWVVVVLSICEPKLCDSLSENRWATVYRSLVPRLVGVLCLSVQCHTQWFRADFRAWIA